MNKGKVVICGGGGFIGGHLVGELLKQGYTDIRSVDIKPLDEWYNRYPNVENLVLDLQDLHNCRTACKGAQIVYNLAADMGGMGFIENNKALCMLSVLINTHLLMASKEVGVERYFYASSACVYNGEKQVHEDVTALKEEDAYPALPEDGYGWEKLFSERMCRHFREDFGITWRGWRGFTMCMDRWERGKAGARKRRPRCAGSSLKPSCPGSMRSKSGAMATRRGRSCTSRTARRGFK